MVYQGVQISQVTREKEKVQSSDLSQKKTDNQVVGQSDNSSDSLKEKGDEKNSTEKKPEARKDLQLEKMQPSKLLCLTGKLKEKEGVWLAEVVWEGKETNKSFETFGTLLDSDEALGTKLCKYFHIVCESKLDRNNHLFVYFCI